MTTHKPTAEQTAVLDAFGSGSTLVVEAGAGCGKSSTLKMAAHTTSRRGIYVAYNRALADEAKQSFPGHVRCSTAHGLAFGPVGKRYEHRLNGPRLPARETARILGIREPVRLAPDRAPIAPQQLARLVMETVNRFCGSADDEPGPQHIWRIQGLSTPEMTALRTALLPWVRKAWDDLVRIDGQLKFSHDCYLKIYQLSRPKLPCDFLLLDEAQDSSPVMAAIFDDQTHAQRIMVGDGSQAIYQWRGAIDAMSRFEADKRLTLSQSFRFGQAIADEANKWLNLLDAPIRLRGFDQITSTVGPVEQPRAVLCRSNSECVAQLMAAAQADRRAALVGGGVDIRRLAEAAITLKQGAGTDHPELFMFSSWPEIQQYVAEDSAGSDLRVFVKLIDEYGPAKVIETVDQIVPEDHADVVISTAHKAKGREWSSVRIAGDFHEPSRDKETGEVPEPSRDDMPAYVSVTRAQQHLDRAGLAWVDRYFSAPEPATDPRDAITSGLELTGMPEEQADWEADEPETVSEPAPAVSTHCRRCGSDRCICDPALAAAYAAIYRTPAGPLSARLALLDRAGVPA